MEDKQINEDKRFEKESGFIARYYRKGTLVPDLHFRRFPESLRRRRILRWSAAAAVAVVLTAGAAVVYRNSVVRQPVASEEVTLSVAPAEKPDSVKRIEFTDTPISRVAEEVGKVYGVCLENLPVVDRRITISYEGTASDLVENINELIGSHIVIARDSAGNVIPYIETERKQTK